MGCSPARKSSTLVRVSRLLEFQEARESAGAEENFPQEYRSLPCELYGKREASMIQRANIFQVLTTLLLVYAIVTSPLLLIAISVFFIMMNLIEQKGQKILGRDLPIHQQVIAHRCFRPML